MDRVICDLIMSDEKYNLKHIDTGYIFMEALGKGVITEEDGNEI